MSIVLLNLFWQPQVARCHARSTVQHNFIPNKLFRFVLRRWEDIVLRPLAFVRRVQCFSCYKDFNINRQIKFICIVFYYTKEDIFSVGIYETSIHLRNSWWDSMSINLSVVFYGKGVPLRAGTCSRRVGAWGLFGMRRSGTMEPWYHR